jgi:NADH-quinone oxidoreductase subunit J
MMTDSLLGALTYVLCGAALLLAVAVVTSDRIFRAAVYLMGVLALSAAFYLFMGAELMAGIQLLVYVGGIVVLLVFAVMLTSTVETREAKPALTRKLLGLLVAGGFFAVSATVFVSAEFAVVAPGALPANNAVAIGEALLNTGAGGYVLPFELIALLLLAAVMGGIVVARKSEAPREPLEGRAGRAGDDVTPSPGEAQRAVGEGEGV